ncbi:transposase [Streptomyces sp. 3213.3]|uniref:transposase n=1 Tax=Streptomyces sp. 3213.3 TaxID=1855348 RepID=UPI000B81856B
MRRRWRSTGCRRDRRSGCGWCRTGRPSWPWGCCRVRTGTSSRSIAAVLVAEIGDVTRFTGPGQLCSWAGLTPRHRASDSKVRRGPITKQGSPLLRWGCVEAIQRSSPDTPIRCLKDRIIERRGIKARNVAKSAAGPQAAHPGPLRAARRHVRCLAQTGRCAGRNPAGT